MSFLLKSVIWPFENKILKETKNLNKQFKKMLTSYCSFEVLNVIVLCIIKLNDFCVCVQWYILVQESLLKGKKQISKKQVHILRNESLSRCWTEILPNHSQHGKQKRTELGKVTFLKSAALNAKFSKLCVRAYVIYSPRISKGLHVLQYGCF